MAQANDRKNGWEVTHTDKRPIYNFRHMLIATGATAKQITTNALDKMESVYGVKYGDANIEATTHNNAYQNAYATSWAETMERGTLIQPLE